MAEQVELIQNNQYRLGILVPAAQRFQKELKIFGKRTLEQNEKMQFGVDRRCQTCGNRGYSDFNPP